MIYDGIVGRKTKKECPRSPDHVICIPSRRPAPLKTLQSYEIPEGINVIIISDPDFYEQHREFYERRTEIEVVPGKRGLGANKGQGYWYSAMRGFRFFLSLDDDLPKNFFIHKDGSFPDLLEILTVCRKATLELGVTFTGFSRTTNRFYMGETYRRFGGLLDGKANYAFSSLHPEQFLDPVICRAEEAYRTCSHREYDRLVDGNEGNNAVIGFIGMDRRLFVPTAVTSSDPEIEKSRDLILERYGHIVNENGYGLNHCPMWKFKPAKKPRR